MLMWVKEYRLYIHIYKTFIQDKGRYVALKGHVFLSGQTSGIEIVVKLDQRVAVCFLLTTEPV